jgi:hypothetical protein
MGTEEKAEGADAIHTPSQEEVEQVFTDTPEAAAAAAETSDAMTDVNRNLQAGVKAHVEAAGPVAPPPDAFDDVAQGGHHA